MPYGSERIVIKAVAGEALTDWQHKAVTIMNGTALKPDSAQGEFVSGILETGNAADGTLASGSIVSVCVFGKTKAVANAASIATMCMSETTGLLSAVATTKWAIGYFLEATDAQDHLAEFFVTGPHYYNTD